MTILVLNGGSSSFKCWLADLPETILPNDMPAPLWEAHLEDTRAPGSVMVRIRGSNGRRMEREARAASPAAALEQVLESLWIGPNQVNSRHKVNVVGHRIVHGGGSYRDTTLVTKDVKAAIARQVEFAPAHNRFELEAIETAERVFGSGTKQVAVFDTAFHAHLERAAYVYPGPHAWLERCIRRFGFHGISHQYASRRAAEILLRPLPSLRLIICHLGNGCSLAAVRSGRSVDPTMGFIPLEGLIMGTRCGSIDPGIIIYRLRHRGYSAEQLDRILNHESGLKGISGLSGDMREIIAAMSGGNERAKLAFDVYVHRLCRENGAMMASLGGADALVFTGGVGENSPLLRGAVCRNLGFFGVKLDLIKNNEARSDGDIASEDSAVRVLMIRAQEEWEIARECHRIVSR